jgi:hypothetical protein
MPDIMTAAKYAESTPSAWAVPRRRVGPGSLLVKNLDVCERCTLSESFQRLCAQRNARRRGSTRVRKKPVHHMHH